MNDAARREAGIRLTKDGPLARVTIDRPQVMNALSRAAHAALSSIWDDIRDDADIRVAILTGAGTRAFCAGTDLKDPEAKNGVPYLWDGPRLGAGGLSFRRDLLKPVIAAVNGLALGTGFELALACDLIIAAEHAEFGFPEPRVGYMALDGGIAMLTRQVPYKIAMGMLLTGRRVSARDGHAAGFVNEVASSDGLTSAAEKWAADVVACAPLSVEGTKQIAMEGRDLPGWAAPRWFPRRVMEAVASEDSEEGTRAFREKRPPRWKGR
ncbi:MAG TPA: enoyl-CoA hydratase-related protein [bacterium]|nr:enoyl-CoA hydratase-related protein [bacterium]